MGFGLGAAIGSAMYTNERTVLFTGDGSFGMNLNELATVATQNLPIVIILMNNGVLGMVRQWQNLFFDKHYSQTVLERKRICKIGRSLWYQRVSNQRCVSNERCHRSGV